MSNIAEFPPKPPRETLLIGPFQKWKVRVEGRIIPGLSGFTEGPDTTFLTVDDRFSIAVPNELAPQVAWLVAQAMAVAHGYSHLGAEGKGAMPFAPKGMEIGGDRAGGEQP